MESLGKQVSVDGEPLPFKAGEIIFGEPGGWRTSFHTPSPPSLAASGPLLS